MWKQGSGWSTKGSLRQYPRDLIFSNLFSLAVPGGFNRSEQSRCKPQSILIHPKGLREGGLGSWREEDFVEEIRGSTQNLDA